MKSVYDNFTRLPFRNSNDSLEDGVFQLHQDLRAVVAKGEKDLLNIQCMSTKVKKIHSLSGDRCCYRILNPIHEFEVLVGVILRKPFPSHFSSVYELIPSQCRHPRTPQDSSDPTICLTSFKSQLLLKKDLNSNLLNVSLTSSTNSGNTPPFLLRKKMSECFKYG